MRLPAVPEVDRADTSSWVGIKATSGRIVEYGASVELTLLNRTRDVLRLGSDVLARSANAELDDVHLLRRCVLFGSRICGASFENS